MDDTGTLQRSDFSVEFTFAVPPPSVPTADTHQNYVRPPALSGVDAGIYPTTGLFDSYLDHVSSPSSPGSPPVTTDVLSSLGSSSDGYPQN